LNSTHRKDTIGNPLISEITGKELFKQPIDKKKTSMPSSTIMPISLINKLDSKLSKANKLSKTGGGSLEVSFPHSIKNS